MQDGVKSRECDQGCENRQVFLVVQASTRNCRVVVEPEKTLGNRSTRMQCYLLRPNERLMKKNKTNERTLDVRIGREAYGSRGREGERVVVTIITGSQQGQCKFGMVGRRISLQTPPFPEHFGLPLYFWRSYFFTPSSLSRHRYTGAQHHANLRAYNNVTLNSALATEKGFG